MMTFKVFSDSDRTQYEQFVAAHGGSFLQSWNWGEFQTKTHQKVLRAGLGDSELKLSAQFIEQSIPHLGGKYLYCPYGPVGDLNLVQQLVSELKRQYPEYWFIRLEPQKNYPHIGTPTLRIQPGKTLITDLTLSDEELLASMHQKTRYNIRVARKHGVEIITAATTEDTARALDLITETSSRQGFTDHPRSYYEKLVSEYPNSKIYLASYGGQTLNCAIMVDHNDTRTYLFGGSSAEHKNVMSPYLMHWQAMLEAKSEGKTKYDWWGIETATGKTPGFARFKLGWPGEQINYPDPNDIINKSAHYLTYKLLRSLNRLF